MIIMEQAWGLLELVVMIALSVIGCRVSPRGFLYTLLGLLIVFSLAIGNPVGLLVSGGGWMILDLVLIAAVLVAFGVAYFRDRGRRPTEEGSRR
jgi:hypothetical protein